MVRFLLLFLILYFTQPSFGQQEEKKIFFSEVLSQHLPNYEKKAKKAYALRDYNLGRELFDSLVKFELNESYMDNFKFNQLNSKEITFYDFKKPVYLITYSSWCVASEGEIPALNQLASKYHDKIDFVILFWDDKRTTRQMAKAYNENIKILYVDEMQNNGSYVISQLKHSLGLPTTFLIDGNKKILDIRRGVTHSFGKSFEESFDLNYNSIYDGIANQLLGEENNYAGRQTAALN
ncbi:MAG: TlpA family protein disulfide reductase [Flavobacteriaceae bacterium]|nr:TlpA family protein disulfide reductase [Flavobacteriaceae bacterium]